MQSNALQARPDNPASKTKFAEEQFIDPQAFLDLSGVKRKVVEYGKEVEYGHKVTVFTQGDPATSVLYILEGSVKLAVVNEAGKEAVLAILGPGDFLGEGCLAGQTQRANTAEATTRCKILVIEKREMIRLLQAERDLSERSLEHMLLRNIRLEEDLIDQIFSSCEKRLARTLLLLAHDGKQGQPQKVAVKMSQETLAEMVGTTRSRVNFFMNKFRKLGFISYGAGLRGLRINESLLSAIVQD